jgi:hypothetical protein
MEPSNLNPDDGTLIVPHPPADPQAPSPEGDVQPPATPGPPTGLPPAPFESAQLPSPEVISPDNAPGTLAVVAGDFSAPAASPMPAPMPNPAPSAGFEPAQAYPPPPAPLPPSPQPFFSAPAPPAAPVFGGGDPLVAPAPSPRKRPAKSLLMALAAVLVVGVGSAAAYVGVIVPNKPANVLKAAFINSLQQTQSSTSGTFSATGGGIYKGTFNTAEDTTAKAIDAQFNLTVSGVNFSVETRLVNQNLYIKVGDLSTIAGLVNGFYPSAGSLVQSLSSDLSNKWIVVDSTLLNQSAGIKCALNTSWTLTNADIKLLESQYNKNPFTTIQSTSSDKVGGQPAEKFVLNIDNSKLDAFGNGSVQNLSAVKALQKCPGSTTTTTKASTTGHGQTPLTVWVDKGSKRIVQISATSNNKNSSVSGSTTVQLHYGKVSITAPNNAESALKVLTDIQNSAKSNPALLNLLGSGSAAAGGNNVLTQ